MTRQSSDSRALGPLLDGIVGAPSAAPERISGVYADSRRVQPGGLFVALRGSAADGARFVDDAVGRGAAVVLGENLPPRADAIVLNVSNARAALSRLAVRWHELEEPLAQHVRLIGVTGTNGKTTTAHMARSIFRAAGERCGMLGTVQFDLCNRSVTADMTTPGPLELAAYLRECIDVGATRVVMEVSSHALDQQRTEGLRFAAAIFTNLTQDHLDYHGTLEAYADAKARLFAELDADGLAVVNRDDPAYERMIRDCKARVVTYSLDQPADVTATISRNSIGGTVFRVRIGGEDVVLENGLVGRHNVYNALGALTAARFLGTPLEAIESGLAAVRNIPGRLQRVPALRGVEVFVDYAHTDDALRNVTSVLRPLARQRLIVIFGCGGDRDRGKRPKMARAALERADAVVITSDNPRTEDPMRIIEDVLTGVDDSARRKVVVEPDRRSAIRAAMVGAAPGDVVLIAGKGHENYQIVGHEHRRFDDVEVAIQVGAELSRSGEGAA